jgi:hypothetical protein
LIKWAIVIGDVAIRCFQSRDTKVDLTAHGRSAPADEYAAGGFVKVKQVAGLFLNRLRNDGTRRAIEIEKSAIVDPSIDTADRSRR